MQALWKLTQLRPSGCHIPWQWSPGSPQDLGPDPHQAEARPPCWLTVCFPNSLLILLISLHLTCLRAWWLPLAPFQLDLICTLETSPRVAPPGPLQTWLLPPGQPGCLSPAEASCSGELVFFLFFLLSPPQKNHVCYVRSSFYMFSPNLSTSPLWGRWDFC